MADLSLIRPDNFVPGLDALPEDVKDNFLQLIERSNTQDGSLAVIESFIGTATLALITGNNLNSGFKGYYRFDTTTTNNPYGVGFVLGSQYGATSYVQVIYSITQRRLVYRISTNSGATWTDVTEVLTASSIKPIPTPNWLTGTTFNMVVAGIPLTRTNSAGDTITLPVATYTVNLATLGLNGLSQVGFNSGVRHYIYMAQKRETVVPTVGLVSGLIVAPTAGLNSIVISSITYDLYEITGLDFRSITSSGVTAIPSNAFLNLSQSKEFTKAEDTGKIKARVNFNQSVSANLTGTFSRAGSLVTGIVTAHGMRTGHRIRAKHTGSGSIDDEYDITVIDANTFTYTTATSGTITSNTLTLPRFQINSSTSNKNVSFVANTEQGWTAIVNYTVELSDIYAVNSYTAIKALGVNAFSLTNSRLLTMQTPNVNYIYLENYAGDFSGQNQCNQCGLVVT